MNILRPLYRNRIGKAAAGVGLCLSIVFSGSIAFAGQPAQAAAASSDASVADKIIQTGEQFIGTPYRFGAKSGQTGSFDCSSFTQYVFKQNGIDLPRSSKQQASAGTVVSKDQLQPGDLVFSDTNHDGIINHVSIYIGNDQLLHTYRVGIGVTISEFAGSAWDRGFVTARRVIPDHGQASADPNGQASAASAQAPATSDSQTLSKPQADSQTSATGSRDDGAWYGH